MILAQEILTTVTPENRKAAAAQFTFANQWLTAKQPAKAAELLQYCCQLEPTSLVYRQALRNAQYQLPPSRGFLARFKKWSRLQQLLKAQHSKDWPSVLVHAECMLTLDAANVAAHLALAQAFECMGLLEHGTWCLEQVANRSEITPTLARLYERTGKYVEARALLEPNAANGASQQVLDDEQSVLETLRANAAIAGQRLVVAPDDPELLAIAARLRHELDAREIELCRQKSDRFPEDMQLRLELGVALLKAGQFDAALDAFKAARSNPQMAWKALVYSGYCHLNRGQWRKAKPFFEEALPMIPPEAEATRKEVESLLAKNPR
jgi:tetratricopeptide (TPR) repeat protein